MSTLRPPALDDVLDALESAGVAYMVVGSFASNYWGRPRSTHDADLVVILRRRHVMALAEALSDDFYAPDFAIREALDQGDQFNAIHLDTAFKVDVWLLTVSEYDAVRFSRRLPIDLMGRTVLLSTPEDTILSKLRWHRDAGGDTRQYLDALEVYEIQKPVLDEAYLDHWAERLGLSDLLQRVRSEAAEPQ